LKEIIRDKPIGIKKIEEFEILGDIEGCNIADKFNVYYIQNINNTVEHRGEGRRGF